MKKLVIGNDHAATDLKKEIMAYLESKGYEVVNVGTDGYESCNYPVYGYRAARMVADGEVDGGILICGSGVGISLTANKVDGVRCCVCSEPYSAKMSREHNNSNMVAFGARVVGPDMAKMIVDAWLEAEFQGGRHETRVNMIMEVQDTQKLTADK
ncbi:MAG: ribose 5-phosphate isomerase B [Lachnospiraceae bacterium]|nr:ribose 5-phosphate isomerase B [Lachnospiraceae bacterium]